MGEMYRRELLRIAEDACELDNAEVSALLAQTDAIAAGISRMFRTRALDGHEPILAHLLRKDEAATMVNTHSSPALLIGLRKRRSRDFWAFVTEQGNALMEVLYSRATVAYLSREWGLWLVQLRKIAKLRLILAMLRVQGMVYACGFETDPTANFGRLADLLGGRQEAPAPAQIRH